MILLRVMVPSRGIACPPPSINDQLRPESARPEINCTVGQKKPDPAPTDFPPARGRGFLSIANNHLALENLIS
jgi:hypothetical protein